MSYIKQLTGYVNRSKNGNGQYLTITNVSEKDIVLKAGDKLFLNRTPAEILEKYPKVPHYSKDIKVEDEPATKKELTREEVEEAVVAADQVIPF